MSLVNTLTQELRGIYAGRYDKNEVRASQYGALETFKEQSMDPLGILTQDVKDKIKVSFGNTVKIPVLDRRTVTIGNTRACTVSDSENTSQLVALTFATYAFGFTMVPSQYFNNDIKYQQDFTRKLDLYLKQLLIDLDTLAVSTLDTAKNQYWQTMVTDIYAQSGNALQVPQADKDDMYNNMEAIMSIMDFYGRYDVVANTVHRPMVSRLVAQGQANSVNEGFQFGPFDYKYTNRIVNGTTVSLESTAYVIGKGQLAIDNRNDPDAIAGSKIGDVKEWSITRLPGIDMDFGSYYYQDCGDKSALHSGTTGLTRTRVEGFEFSTDICFVTPYNSDNTTDNTPIVKAEILA